MWIPDLRGIPIGRKGETVAEFNVRSETSELPKKNKKSSKPKPKSSSIKASNKMCNGAKTTIELYRDDGFRSIEQTLDAASPIVGIFGVDFRDAELAK